MVAFYTLSRYIFEISIEVATRFGGAKWASAIQLQYSPVEEGKVLCGPPVKACRVKPYLKMPFAERVKR